LRISANGCAEDESRTQKSQLVQTFSTSSDSADGFEMEVERLGLRVRDYGSSVEMRDWCSLNRNRCYVPEWLLDEWGMEVESIYVE
jgi:hypothetical protein